MAGGPLGTPSVWAFNIVGTFDLLRAYSEGGRTGLGLQPGLQGALYFVPTLLVPLLLVTHALIFRLLLHREGAHADHPLTDPRP
jgi:hypothetical protein